MTETTSPEPVGVHREGAVVIVTMNRPPVNAIDSGMYAALRETFSTIGEQHSEAKVCILRASGPHFCAGNDLAEFGTMTASNAASRMRLVRETFAAIYECTIPVIAAVRGAALGTGIALAACCDIVVASDDARFGTPEVQVGVLGGARHLARLVPEQVMRRMYFTGLPVGAHELQRYGGVSAVVPADQLMDAALQIAGQIIPHSTTALRSAKEALNRTEFMPLKQAYEEEQQLTVRTASHPHSVEARQALLEGRPPRFD